MRGYIKIFLLAKISIIITKIKYIHTILKIHSVAINIKGCVKIEDTKKI